LLLNGANDFASEALQWSRSASQSLGIDLKAFDARDFESSASTFKAMSQAGIEGVIIGSDPVLNDNIKELGALALTYQLPLATTTLRRSPGVLMAYYIDGQSLYRRAAGYVDKILRGVKPADLPIQQPTKFLLLIDLKTASALGLTIPQSLLLRADEVVQ
jgi:putative ABC transport system substrate-binding protein